MPPELLSRIADFIPLERSADLAHFAAASPNTAQASGSRLAASRAFMEHIRPGDLQDPDWMAHASALVQAMAHSQQAEVLSTLVDRFVFWAGTAPHRAEGPGAERNRAIAGNIPQLQALIDALPEEGPRTELRDRLTVAVLRAGTEEHRTTEDLRESVDTILASRSLSEQALQQRSRFRVGERARYLTPFLDRLRQRAMLPGTVTPPAETKRRHGSDHVAMVVKRAKIDVGKMGDQDRSSLRPLFMDTLPLLRPADQRQHITWALSNIARQGRPRSAAEARTRMEELHGWTEQATRLGSKTAKQHDAVMEAALAAFDRLASSVHTPLEQLSLAFPRLRDLALTAPTQAEQARSLVRLHPVLDRMPAEDRDRIAASYLQAAARETGAPPYVNMHHVEAFASALAIAQDAPPSVREEFLQQVPGRIWQEELAFHLSGALPAYRDAQRRANLRLAFDAVVPEGVRPGQVGAPSMRNAAIFGALSIHLTNDQQERAAAVLFRNDAFVQHVHLLVNAERVRIPLGDEVDLIPRLWHGLSGVLQQVCAMPEADRQAFLPGLNALYTAVLEGGPPDMVRLFGPVAPGVGDENSRLRILEAELRHLNQLPAPGGVDAQAALAEADRRVESMTRTFDAVQPVAWDLRVMSLASRVANRMVRRPTPPSQERVIGLGDRLIDYASRAPVLLERLEGLGGDHFHDFLDALPGPLRTHFDQRIAAREMDLAHNRPPIDHVMPLESAHAREQLLDALEDIAELQVMNPQAMQTFGPRAVREWTEANEGNLDAVRLEALEYMFINLHDNRGPAAPQVTGLFAHAVFPAEAVRPEEAPRWQAVARQALVLNPAGMTAWLRDVRSMPAEEARRTSVAVTEQFRQAYAERAHLAHDALDAARTNTASLAARSQRLHRDMPRDVSHRITEVLFGMREWLPQRLSTALAMVLADRLDGPEPRGRAMVALRASQPGRQFVDLADVDDVQAALEAGGGAEATALGSRLMNLIRAPDGNQRVERERPALSAVALQVHQAMAEGTPHPSYRRGFNQLLLAGRLLDRPALEALAAETVADSVLLTDTLQAISDTLSQQELTGALTSLSRGLAAQWHEATAPAGTPEQQQRVRSAAELVAGAAAHIVDPAARRAVENDIQNAMSLPDNRHEP